MDSVISLFLNRKLGAFIECVEKELKNTDDLCKKTSLLTNLASAQFELGLFRKCIKTSQQALNIDPLHIRAGLIQGKAYEASGKYLEAFERWNETLEKANSDDDILLIQELFLSLKECKEKNNIDEKKKDIPITRKNKENHDKLIIEREEKNIEFLNENETKTEEDISEPKKEKVKRAEEKDYLDTSKKALTSFYNRTIGEGPEFKVKPFYIEVMKNNLPHLTGEALVDDLIAFGYININSGQNDITKVVFKLLLEYRIDLPSALIGIGSIYAMEKKFELAIAEFGKAISCNSGIAEAWKRRGQTRAALGMFEGAVEDLSEAFQLNPRDEDTLYQRGIVYHQAKNYLKALPDFQMALIKGIKTPTIHNYIGLCEGQLGNTVSSINFHTLALAVDSKFKEANLNVALMHKEVGNWELALEFFERTISIDQEKPFFPAFTGRALLYYQMGKLLESLADAKFVLFLAHYGMKDKENAKNADVVTNLHRVALCCQSLGQFEDSLGFFKDALKLDEINFCFYQREIAIILWQHLDTKFCDFSIDDKIDPRLKDGWSKRLNWKKYLDIDENDKNLIDQKNVYKLAEIPKKIPSLGQNPPDTSKKEWYLNILKLTAPIGSWIQLKCQGFLPNARQHKMFGLAVLQMSIMLRKHLSLIHLGGVGLAISDQSSSAFSRKQNEIIKTSTKGVKSPMKSKKTSKNQLTSGKRGEAAFTHTLQWRDLIDIVVRWRQISEPNDCVFWIDRFPEASFAEGYGLHTPIVNGQLRTIRYYSYFDKTFSMVKKLLHLGYVTVEDKFKQLESDGTHLSQVDQAKTLTELYEAIGEDFYVIMPCKSLIQEGLILEGTRLTLQKTENEGFEFSIRTAGKPKRWAQFNTEIAASFQRLEDAFLPPSPESPKPTETPPKTPLNPDEEKRIILHRVLELFYFFVVFSPLSRGTAICGYSIIYSILLAHGLMINNPMKEGKQLDFEAILQEDSRVFIENVESWFELKKVCDHSKELYEVLFQESGSPLIESTRNIFVEEMKIEENMNQEFQVLSIDSIREILTILALNCPDAENGNSK